MIAFFVCILAFGATYWAGKRSLGQGLLALLTVGYFYGILRANLPTAASHFIFDGGLLGLYFSQWLHSADPKGSQAPALRFWTIILIAWPMLLMLLPFQPLLVSLTGLRGNAFFIPVLLLGRRLKPKDVLFLSYGLAVLNLIAFGFALAEYFMGLTPFYPVNPVTFLIYKSGDVAGTFFRIPAIFANAHSYGGTMVDTLPFLIGLLDQPHKRLGRVIAFLGIGAGLAGVLMSAARLTFIMAVPMILAAFLTTRAVKGSRLMLAVLVAGVAWLGFNNERLGRFKSLSDTDYVSERVAGSVNRGFGEILIEHPMGNGLGGGGTSMPYFLEQQVRNPIGMENSYALILCEQGIIGLILWIAFIAWFFSRAPIAFAKGPWVNCRRLAWCLTAFSFGTGWIGTGLFTSIPGTVFLLIAMGWTSGPQIAEPEWRDEKQKQLRLYRPRYAPSFSEGLRT